MEPLRARIYPLLLAAGALLIYLGWISERDAVEFAAFAGALLTFILGPAAVENARGRVTPVTKISTGDSGDTIWETKTRAPVIGTFDPIPAHGHGDVTFLPGDDDDGPQR